MSNPKEPSLKTTKIILPIAAIALAFISLVLLAINVSLFAKWDDALCNASHLFGLLSFIAGLAGLSRYSAIEKDIGRQRKFITAGMVFGVVPFICHILVWIRNFLLFMIYVQ